MDEDTPGKLAKRTAKMTKTYDVNIATGFGLLITCSCAKGLELVTLRQNKKLDGTFHDHKPHEMETLPLPLAMTVEIVLHYPLQD